MDGGLGGGDEEERRNGVEVVVRSAKVHESGHEPAERHGATRFGPRKARGTDRLQARTRPPENDREKIEIKNDDDEGRAEGETRETEGRKKKKKRADGK